MYPRYVGVIELGAIKIYALDAIKFLILTEITFFNNPSRHVCIFLKYILSEAYLHVMVCSELTKNWHVKLIDVVMSGERTEIADMSFAMTAYNTW